MATEPTPRPPDDSDEVAHYDDAIIGRAFRWSLVALAALVVAGGILFVVLRRPPPPPPPQVTPLAAPAAPTAPSVEPPTVKFTDITREAGIDFVHANGAYGDKLLPETMGGGVAFFDADADGDPDLLFVNSTWWPWKPLASGDPPRAGLYRNEGGRFTNVTAGSGLDVALYGMGVAVGDYDNDGLPDVLITGVGGNRLFHNEGGFRFRDGTAAAGVGGETNDWNTCATWLDYDRDGRLDLFVGNYIRWSREIDFEVGYKLVGVGRAYGQPNNFEGAFPRLYHNEGQGRFADVSERSGVRVRNKDTGVALSKPLGVVAVDLDSDGWSDLVVANDTVQNLVFHNQRDGTFREMGALSGLAFDLYGNTRGAMGIDAARFRNDDRVGIAIGNFANEMTALYVAQLAPMQFADEAIAEGVGPASRLLLKFGVFFFDYDLDGWLDLLSANGHLEDEIHKVQQSQSYAQPAQLFWNAGCGPGGFQVVSTNHVGSDLFRPMVGRGSAYADIDGDGDLDVVLTQVGGAPRLLRNDQALGHHWLRVQLIGKRCNREAQGARVTVRTGALVQTREVTPTHSYLSQSELPVTFGLGKVAAVDALEVQWPGGGRAERRDVPADHVLVIEEE